MDNHELGCVCKSCMEKLDRIFHVPFVFGLKAQGHIPTIETMLSEGKTWDDIGKKIGWCPKTAKKHWDSYQKEENRNDS